MFFSQSSSGEALVITYLCPKAHQVHHAVKSKHCFSVVKQLYFSAAFAHSMTSFLTPLSFGIQETFFAKCHFNIQTLKFSTDSPSFIIFWSHDPIASPPDFSSLFTLQHIAHWNGTVKNQDFLSTANTNFILKVHMEASCNPSRNYRFGKPSGYWTLTVSC